MDTMKKTDTQNPELTDISDLNLQLQMLKTALTQAQEANRAKSTFLSNMSHDIRTPMNAIAGMAAIALSHIDEGPGTGLPAEDTDSLLPSDESGKRCTGHLPDRQ